MTKAEVFRSILNSYLKKYKIKVLKWRKNDSGCCYDDKSGIEIPDPININYFIVCMHEIGHYTLDKKSEPLYMSEYNASKYSELIMKRYNFIFPAAILNRYRNYVLHFVIQEVVKNVDNFESVPQDVIDYCRIDKAIWLYNLKKKYMPTLNHLDSDYKKVKIVWKRKPAADSRVIVK